jgi:hypothetical protein
MRSAVADDLGGPEELFLFLVCQVEWGALLLRDDRRARNRQRGGQDRYEWKSESRSHLLLRAFRRSWLMFKSVPRRDPE